jgi:hypothetical protein
MKGRLLLTSAAFVALQINAEEVLSSRPLVIAPRRIEAKSVDISGRQVTQHSEQSEKTDIDANRILLLITFRKGSIRLTEDTERQLLALGIKQGQQLRVFGFGDPADKKAARIANLRARVIASFLKEKIGRISIEINWNEKPHRKFPGAGAIIEGVL